MAIFPGFVGPTYALNYPVADCEVAMNLFAEAVAGGAQGKSPTHYYRTPGKKLFATLPKGPLRCIFAGDHRAFAVGGDTVYEIFNDGTPPAALAGAIINAATPAQIISNGNQLFIVSGNQGYLVNDGHTVVPIQFMDPATGTPTGALLAAVMGTILDGYFVAQLQDSANFAVSDNSSGLGGYSWNPLTVGTKESSPDHLAAIIASRNELWLQGNQTGEVWDDNGAPPPGVPFTRNTAGTIQQGNRAPWSVALMDDESLMWFGGSSRGIGVIYKSQGYSPVRVSTHAVETAIQGYLRTDDAIAYTYQENGHSNYVITFPNATATGGATWCYDATMNFWHQRGYWDINNARYDADLARFHAFCFDKHLVGGGDGTGKIYEQSLDIQDDDGNPIRWWRRAPHINDEANWVRHISLQIDMQVGIAAQGADPQVTMRYSSDGGQNWSNEKTKSAGKVGEYMRRVIWFQLGRSRDCVYEIYGTDPMPVCIVAAYLDLAGMRRGQ